MNPVDEMRSLWDQVQPQCGEKLASDLIVECILTASVEIGGHGRVLDEVRRGYEAGGIEFVEQVGRAALPGLQAEFDGQAVAMSEIYYRAPSTAATADFRMAIATETRRNRSLAHLAQAWMVIADRDSVSRMWDALDSCLWAQTHGSRDDEEPEGQREHDVRVSQLAIMQRHLARILPVKNDLMLRVHQISEAVVDPNSVPTTVRYVVRGYVASLQEAMDIVRAGGTLQVGARNYMRFISKEMQ